MIPYPLWALATCSIWGLLVGGIAAMNHRFARDERASPRFVALLTTIVAVCYVSVGLIPVATGLLAGAAPDSATQHIVATSVGASIAGLLVFMFLQHNHLVAFEAHTARGRTRSRAQSLLGVVGSILILVSIGNWIWLDMMTSVPRGDSILAIVTFIALGVSLIVFQRRLAGVGARGATLSLDESPLKDELRSIAEYFGQDDTRLRIQTTRSDRASDEEMTPEQVAIVMRTWQFQRRMQTIPIELVQRVEPREVTAAVAFRYALITPPKRDRLVLRIIFLCLGAVAIVMGVGAGVGMFQPFLGGAFHIVLSMGMGVATLLYLLWALRALGLVRNPEQRFVDAHAAWKGAELDEERDYVGYVAALLASDRLTLMLGPDADLIPLVHKNIGLVSAAKVTEGLEEEEFLRRLRHRLSKNRPV